MAEGGAILPRNSRAVTQRPKIGGSGRIALTPGVHDQLVPGSRASDPHDPCGKEP